MAGTTETLAARVRPQVKAALSDLAKADGRTLAAYVSDLLTRHVLRTDPPDVEARRAPRPQHPPLDPELFGKVTDAVRELTNTISDFREVDRLERDDFYAALANVFHGLLTASGMPGGFTEKTAGEFIDRVFRKPLLSIDDGSSAS